MNRKLSDRKYYLKNKDRLKKASREYRKNNKEKCKQRDKQYYINNKDKISRVRMKTYYQTTKNIKRTIYLKDITKPLHLWVSTHGKTIKENARILLQRAVRKERIIKPNKCSGCTRKLPKKLIHAHHSDYKKWWDVIWLCQTCHSELHLMEVLEEYKDNKPVILSGLTTN